MYLLELNEKVVKDFNKIPLKARSKIWKVKTLSSKAN